MLKKRGGIKILNNMGDQRGVINMVVKVDTSFSSLEEINLSLMF